jgi:hypothetical protein
MPTHATTNGAASPTTTNSLNSTNSTTNTRKDNPKTNSAEMPSRLGPSGDERGGGDSEVGLSDAPSSATTVSSPRDPCISCTTVGTTRMRYSYQGAYNTDIRCERVPVDLVILPILGIEWSSFQIWLCPSKRGADVNARAGPDLEALGDVFTPLHRASIFGALEVQ